SNRGDAVQPQAQRRSVFGFAPDLDARADVDRASDAVELGHASRAVAQRDLGRQSGLVLNCMSHTRALHGEGVGCNQERGTANHSYDDALTFPFSLIKNCSNVRLVLLLAAETRVGRGDPPGPVNDQRRWYRL